MNKKWVFAIIVCLSAGLIACEKESVSPEDLSSMSVNVATIAIHSGDKVHNVNVEVATTDEQRAKGLMGRESLPENYGMWFIFPFEVQDPFWMKDTYVPLDIIFVGSNFKIVDIIANTVPKSTEHLISQFPYRYALEISAGFTDKHGIKAGDVVEQRVGPQ